MKCRSCGAAIEWAVSEKGRPMPIDAVPVPNGNLHLRYIKLDDPPIAVRLSEEEIAKLKQQHGLRVAAGWEKERFTLYLSHSDSCVDLEAWRK